MQINNDLKTSSSSLDPKSLSLKEGDVSSGLVKEKLPNNEAIVNVKGQEVKLKLQGEFNVNERLKFQIKDPHSQPPTGKIVERTPVPARTTPSLEMNSGSSRLKSVDGLPLDIKSAIDSLAAKGIKVSKESLDVLKTYIADDTRSMAQKSETLQIIAKKQLDITAAVIKSVDQALHGGSVSKSLDHLLKSIDPDFDWSQVRDNIQKERQIAFVNQKTLSETEQLILRAETAFPKGSPQIVEAEKLIDTIRQLDKAGLQRMNEAIEALLKTVKDAGKLQVISEMKNLLIKQPASQSVLTQLNELVQTESEEHPSQPLLKDAAKLSSIKANLAARLESLLSQEAEPIDNEPAQKLLQQLVRAFQKEPVFTKAMDDIKENLVESPSLSRGQKAAITSSVNKAEQLFTGGKELAARQEILKVLLQVEKQETAKPNPAVVTDQFQNKAEAYQLNDDILSMIPTQSKDIIVNTITKKLSQMAIDFKEFKNDISKNLQAVQQVIQQAKSRASITAKPMLETTIKQLDQAILKSDFMLYTDMKTEKDLLAASTRLAEARKLLAKGDHTGAHKIVHEVKTNVEKIIFKPSDVRVKHFVAKEVLQYEPAPLINKMGETISRSVQSLSHEPSARHTFEYLRSMGLTHESEHAQSLVQTGRGKEDLQLTLKNILMKFNQDTDMLGTSKGDQLLQNLTGQQLISKNDSSGLQNLMFTLPLLLKDQVEDVKVYISSKNQQQKVDWENCSLYFLIETKKLGEVGIGLSAVERTLSVQIKNDRDGFKERMEPVANLAKKRLEEIGYKIGSIQFSKLDNQTQQDHVDQGGLPPQRPVPKMTEKGYDFTI
ncbi:hypothetical protein [Bacillus sp. SG-1]|uniref:hypothetical protein n=1 Tax=Bacillus sp. SG-1 TaxID=161544 RepID=UPI0006943CCB|nr:hypothetical protein [Bacillus sp. SG-1]